MPVSPKRYAAVWAATIALSTSQALAIDTTREDVRAFVDEMVAEHGLDRDGVIAELDAAESQESILEAISRPAERVRPWHEYREIFLTEERIRAGLKFWAEHEDTIERVSQETGVPPEILLGIIGVESYYGRITGKYRVIDALVTLGFDYPPRSKFFRGELGEFFLLAREESIDMSEALGSYAGAMGPPQFIPSSYRAYAVDSDGDGRVNLFTSWTDVIGSIANYFIAHRWRPGAPVVDRARLSRGYSLTLPERNTLRAESTVGALRKRGVHVPSAIDGKLEAEFIRLDGKGRNEYWVGYHNFYVITRYNRSVMYALAVWQLGKEITNRRGDDAN